MTVLRMRMDNDMLARGMAERTRETYRAAIIRLARFYTEYGTYGIRCQE